MPNFWAHRICAGVTLDRLEGSPAAELIRQNAVSYRLGSQGADMLYFRPTQFLRGRKGVVYHAKMLHAQPVGKLAEMSRAYLAGTAGRRQFGSTFAYICGFLSHHAVDQRVHPYIERHTSHLMKHRRIELDFDAYLAGVMGVKPDHNRACWAGMADFVGMAGMALWYNHMFHNLYSKRFSLKSYKRDYKAMKRVSAIINRPKRLEKVKYTDKAVLTEKELHTMQQAALKGAAAAAVLIDRLYKELAPYIPEEEHTVELHEAKQWAI